MVEVSPAAFEALVADAIDALPDEVLDLLENVVIVVEDDPPRDTPDLLGMYDGLSLAERSAGGGEFELPDRVVIFRNPIVDICDSVDEVANEVWVTLVHEVAHFHGLSEQRIHELGWG